MTSEEQLRRQEARLAVEPPALPDERDFIAAILNTVSALVIVLDRDAQVLYFNQACQDVTGYSPEEVKGRCLWDLALLPEPEIGKIRAVFEALSDGHFPNQHENHWIARDGSRHLIAWSNTALTDGNGQVRQIIGTGIDVTESRRAQEAYRMLVEHSLQGLVIVQRGRIVFANEAFSAISGYSMDEVLSWSPEQLRELVYPQDRAQVRARIRRILSEEPAPPKLQCRFINKGGQTRWTEVFLTRIRYRDNPAVQMAIVDVTERKRTERALLQSEARLEGIINTATDAVITIDARQQIILFNDAAERMFGYSSQQVLGERLGLLLPRRYRQNHIRHVQAFSQEGVASRSMGSPGQIWGLRSDGTEFPIEAKISQVTVHGQKYLTIILRDVTSRRRMEQERKQLFEAVSQQRERLRVQAEQLRELAQQVVRAQEEERARVSRELHDEAGQALTGLRYALATLLSDLAPSGAELQERHAPPDVRRRLSEALRLCDATMSQIRMLAHNLRPTTLDNVGLNLTLEGFCRDYVERSDLSIAYEGTETDPLADSIEITLYRFLQEALTNVTRHAGASHVWVTFRVHDDQVSLAVEDDGQGFDVRAQSGVLRRGQGIGLLGMHERVESLGGRLEIQSWPARGTRLVAYLPRTALASDGEE